MFDAQLYRSKQEIETWREHDPIRQLQSWLAQTGLMHADEITAIEAEVATEIAAAVAFAEAGTWESVDDLERFTLMDQVPQ
jgi:TPP-dependent pyruvate/acetoin dehydrogenase alpha subunit